MVTHPNFLSTKRVILGSCCDVLPDGSFQDRNGVNPLTPSTSGKKDRWPRIYCGEVVVTSLFFQWWCWQPRSLCSGMDITPGPCGSDDTTYRYFTYGEMCKCRTDSRILAVSGLFDGPSELLH